MVGDTSPRIRAGVAELARHRDIAPTLGERSGGSGGGVYKQIAAKPPQKPPEGCHIFKRFQLCEGMRISHPLTLQSYKIDTSESILRHVF